MGLCYMLPAAHLGNLRSAQRVLLDFIPVLNCYCRHLKMNRMIDPPKMENEINSSLNFLPYLGGEISWHFLNCG